VRSYGQILVPAAFCGIMAGGGVVYSAASPSSTPAELTRQVEVAKSMSVLRCNVGWRGGRCSYRPPRQGVGV